MRAWPRPELPALPASPGQVEAFDTARRAVVPVGPASGTALLYVCGITPYDATHMGHANTYLAFDLLHRAWLDAGLEVRYAQNVTDVDDPLLERAEATGQDWRELAEEQTDLFRADMTALRIIPPQHFIGVVEALPQIVELTQTLDERGTVYALDDEHPDWYFGCAEAPGFGSISHLERDQMLPEFAEHGGDPDRPGKRDALDALVWRRERPGEPSWDSPFGAGRPGWHVECTAIAQHYLGETVDVQGGGRDLVFPHHEMSAAQGQVATGKPFARAFLHSGMLALEGAKMSKSRGNLVFVSRLLADGTDPMAIRLALLAHHYRSDWEWFGTDLDEAERRLERWRAAVARTSAPAGEPVVEALRGALRRDLDAPRALAVVDKWCAGEGHDAEAASLVRAGVDALLGVAL